MRIPLYGFYTQPDFPQQARDLGYPVFAAVVPFPDNEKMGRGYRIYKVGPGKFEGTYQTVTLAERQEDGAHHWIQFGAEKSMGSASWSLELGLWTCEEEPPDVEEHRAAMDAAADD